MPSNNEREIAPKPPRHPLFVQATIAPVDVDGKLAFALGTIGFALASVLLALNLEGLKASENLWWLGVAVSGFLIGVSGLVYCWWRLRRGSRHARDTS